MADAELKHLKCVRAGKKGAITQRTKEINRLVSDGGSRSRITFLHGALIKVFQSVEETCTKIAELSDNSTLDIEWLEQVRCVVDHCTAEVMEYLDARKDDAPSTVASMTASWIDRHQPGKDDKIVSEEDLETLTLEKDIAEMKAMIGENDDRYKCSDHVKEASEGDKRTGLDDLIHQWSNIPSIGAGTSLGEYI